MSYVSFSVLSTTLLTCRTQSIELGFLGFFLSICHENPKVKLGCRQEFTCIFFTSTKTLVTWRKQSMKTSFQGPSCSTGTQNIRSKLKIRRRLLHVPYSFRFHLNTSSLTNAATCLEYLFMLCSQSRFLSGKIRGRKISC